MTTMPTTIQVASNPKGVFFDFFDQHGNVIHPHELAHFTFRRFDLSNRRDEHPESRFARMDRGDMIAVIEHLEAKALAEAIREEINNSR